MRIITQASMVECQQAKEGRPDLTPISGSIVLLLLGTCHGETEDEGQGLAQKEGKDQQPSQAEGRTPVVGRTGLVGSSKTVAASTGKPPSRHGPIMPFGRRSFPGRIEEDSHVE